MTETLNFCSRGPVLSNHILREGTHMSHHHAHMSHHHTHMSHHHSVRLPRASLVQLHPRRHTSRQTHNTDGARPFLHFPPRVTQKLCIAMSYHHPHTLGTYSLDIGVSGVHEPRCLWELADLDHRNIQDARKIRCTAPGACSQDQYCSQDLRACGLSRVCDAPSLAQPQAVDTVASRPQVSDTETHADASPATQPRPGPPVLDIVLLSILSLPTPSPIRAVV